MSDARNRSMLDAALARVGLRPRFSPEAQQQRDPLLAPVRYDDLQSAAGRLIDTERAPIPLRPEPTPAPRYEDLAGLQREGEASDARDRAAEDYSPLPDELGWFVPPAAMAGDLAGAGGDWLTKGRLSDERSERWSRGGEQAGVDVLADTGFTGQMIDSIAGMPDAMRAEDDARRGDGLAPRSTLDRIGQLGRDLWMGWPESGREARGRAAYEDSYADSAAMDEEFDAANGEIPSLYDEREARERANRAYGDDFWINAPAALEAIPGVGFLPDVARIGRPTSQALREAPGMLTREGARYGQLPAIATGGAVAADWLMDDDGGDLNQLAGGAALATGARFGLPAVARDWARGMEDVAASNAPRTIIEDDGRVVHTFQGGWSSGDGTGAEAIASMRPAIRTLYDDAATTQRPEYYWTPGSPAAPDERLAAFYRNTIGQRPPEGYAFSETPDGVMRLTRQGDELHIRSADDAGSVQGGSETLRIYRGVTGGDTRTGRYWTTDPRYASRQATGQGETEGLAVMSGDATFKNPYRTQNARESAMVEVPEIGGGQAWIDSLRARGHDAIIDDAGNQIYVLDENAVRPAFGPTTARDGGEGVQAESAHVNHIADVVEQDGGRFGEGLQLVVANRRMGIDQDYPFFHIMRDGKRIGDLSVGSVDGAELRLNPRLVPEARRQNIGTQLYQYLERIEGRPLGRSDNLTEAGAGLWGRLDRTRSPTTARDGSGGGQTGNDWQRMYHGTRREFDEFGPMPDNSLGVHVGTAPQADSIIQTSETSVARSKLGQYFPDGSVRPVDVRVRNPLRLEDPETHGWDIGWLRYELDTRGIPFKGDTFNPTMADVRRSLQDAGYDGIVYRNTKEGIRGPSGPNAPQDSLVVFDHSNIRSGIRAPGRKLPPLRHHEGSWIGTSPTGEFREFFTEANAQKALDAGWSVDTAGTHLANLNRQNPARPLPDGSGGQTNNALALGAGIGAGALALGGDAEADDGGEGGNDWLAPAAGVGAVTALGLGALAMRGRGRGGVAQQAIRRGEDVGQGWTLHNDASHPLHDPQRPYMLRGDGTSLSFGSRDEAMRYLAGDIDEGGDPIFKPQRALDDINRHINDEGSPYDDWIGLRGDVLDAGQTRSEMLPDLIGRQRTFEEAANQFGDGPLSMDDVMGAGRRGDVDALDASLGDYRVGGKNEGLPLLSAGAGAVTLGGALALGADDAEAGDGGEYEDETPDWLLPALGIGSVAALFGGRGFRSEVGMSGGRAPRLPQGSLSDASASNSVTGVNGGRARTGTITRTEGGYVAETAREIADAKRTLRTTRDRNLQQWVRRQGGIADDRGDLADLNQGLFGVGRLVRANGGRTLDDLAVNAYEDGYFTRIPTRTELIDAIRANSAGDLANGATREREVIAAARDTLDHFDQAGVDTSVRTGSRDGRLREQLERIVPEGAEAPRKIEETVEFVIPDDPEDWRSLVNVHPWINTPARAQLVIMREARLPTGARRFSDADIADATGYGVDSIKVIVSNARNAGVPIDRAYRNIGVREGGEMLPRVLDILESGLRNGSPLTVKQLAARLGIPETSIRSRMSHARHGHGTFSEDTLARLRAYDERVAQMRGKRKTPGGDAPFVFGALALGGAGALAFGEGEAEAEEFGDVRPIPEGLDLREGNWMEPSWQPTTLPDGSEGVTRTIVGPDGEVHILLAVQTEDAGIEVLGEVGPEYGASDTQPIGEMYPAPFDPGSPTPRERDEAPVAAEEDGGDWLRVGGSVLSGLAARYGAGRAGLRGGLREGAGALAAGATDWAFGGSPEEAAIAAAATPVAGLTGRLVRDEVIPLVADDIARDGRSAEGLALRADPAFRARRDAFAETLSDEAPQVRVMTGDNYAANAPLPAREDELFGRRPLDVSQSEALEQGYYYDRPSDNVGSRRQQFLDADPVTQRDWLTGGDRLPDRGQIGFASGADAVTGQPRTPVLPLPASPDEVAPMPSKFRATPEDIMANPERGTLAQSSRAANALATIADEFGVPVERGLRGGINAKKTAANLATAARENAALQAELRRRGLWSALLVAGAAGSEVIPFGDESDNASPMQ